MLPKSPNTYHTERMGINAVATAVTNLGLIWRETATGDVGVDGQIEYVDPAGQATGRLISVQVKSGSSYFNHEKHDAFLYYPSDSHRAYWEQHPLPVILILHDPVECTSYWADVRQQLRGESAHKALTVKKAQQLGSTSAAELFETAGVNGGQFISDLANVMKAMVMNRSRSAGFPVSHFDLFAHGLTNIARSIYYGMDVALMVAENNLAEMDAEWGVGLGSCEHDFLFDFVKFLISQNLARIEFADCLTDWLEREMQPHFVAPLTTRGRQLVRHIHDIEARMVKSGQLPDGGGAHVAQEAFFGVNPYSFSTRLPRIQAFQRIMLGT